MSHRHHVEGTQFNWCTSIPENKNNKAIPRVWRSLYIYKSDMVFYAYLPRCFNFNFNPKQAIECAENRVNFYLFLGTLQFMQMQAK